MAPRKTPQQKKKNAYRKDVVALDEHPKAARKHRPKAKARANRAYRSRVHSLLRNPSDPEELEARGVSRVRRKRVRKADVLPLGEAVPLKLRRRRDQVAWNFFKSRYRPDVHRDRFVAFLESVVAGRTDASRALALRFREMLGGPRLPGRDAVPERDRLRKRIAWLDAFLDDEPKWRRRLERWIDTLVPEARR